MTLPSLKNLDVKNKTVLLRADFDAPLKEKEGKMVVGDDFRLLQALPTIKHLSQKRAKTVVIAHLGRPKGRDDKKSLLPVAEYLAELLGYKFFAVGKGEMRLPSYQLPHVFFFAEDFRHESVRKHLVNLNPRDIAVLENLKFYPEEGRGDVNFAQALASLAESYVNDAFGSSYDERASVYCLPKLLPHSAGIELEKEVSALSKVLTRPRRPYVVMAGGIKLSDKLSGLSGMLEHVDQAVVGGGLATLFFASLGYEVGGSIIDKESLLVADELFRNFQDKILLPSDVVVARSPKRPDTLRVAPPDKVTPEEMILDIGPDTIKKFSAVIKSAKTIVWSGPMGLFEVREFSHGTKALGMLAAARAGGAAFVIVGGGDTVDAIHAAKVAEYFDFLSTGGSAMLAFLGGQKLPGIETLKV